MVNIKKEKQDRLRKVYLSESLYPETKQYSRELMQSVQRGAESASRGKESFVDNTANKTGQKKRTIKTNIQIAKNIIPEVKQKIYGTELENQKTNLLELARLEPEKQKQISDITQS